MEGDPSVMSSSNANVPFYPSLEKRGKGRFSQHNFKIPLYPPEAVKKLVWCCFTSFRRKPESSVFKELRILWTPVFTGETNTV
jgi:hypothetical protein